MNSRVRFEGEAAEEYRLAGRWYEARRENLGVEFLDAVDDTIERILALPRSGTRVPSIGPDLPVRRLAVTRFPYHVVYLKMDDDLRILAIAHDRRRPGYWKTRLE